VLRARRWAQVNQAFNIPRNLLLVDANVGNMNYFIPKRSTLALTVLFVILWGVTGYADSTSPRLAAYYGNKMMLCGRTAYQWRGSNRP
jgi:hypothetical protein